MKFHFHWVEKIMIEHHISRMKALSNKAHARPYTSRSFRVRSLSSRTWRSKSSRASLSFSRRRLNSILAMCPGCGAPSTPSGSCIHARHEQQLQPTWSKAFQTDNVSNSWSARFRTHPMQRILTVWFLGFVHLGVETGTAKLKRRELREAAMEGLLFEQMIVDYPWKDDWICLQRYP